MGINNLISYLIESDLHWYLAIAREKFFSPAHIYPEPSFPRISLIVFRFIDYAAKPNQVSKSRIFIFP